MDDSASGRTRLGSISLSRASAAEAIQANGFRDGDGQYRTSRRMSGVFLSEWPLDEGDGRSSEALFEIWMPRVIDMSDYELVEDAKPYREWCVPASLINERAEWRRVGDEEADEMRLPELVPENWPDRCLGCGIAGIPQLSAEDSYDNVQVGLCPECGALSFRRTVIQ